MGLVYKGSDDFGENFVLYCTFILSQKIHFTFVKHLLLFFCTLVLETFCEIYARAYAYADAEWRKGSTFHIRKLRLQLP